MRLAATLLALISCASSASAAELVELHIQGNGFVRFGSGPQLNDDQLREQVHVLMKRNPRPDIVMLPEKMTKYDVVAKTIAIFQKEGYGPHFGISGVDQ